MVAATNWNLLKLLIWKNFTLRRRNPMKLFLDFVVPIIMLVFLLYFRAEIKQKTIAAQTSEPIGSQSVDTSKDVIYGPENEILKQIMTKAFPGHKELKAFKTLAAVEIEILKNKNIGAVVQFDSSLADITAPPSILKFVLRVPTTDKWNLKERYAITFQPGKSGLEINNPYEKSAFISAQTAISTAFIELASKKDSLPKVTVKAFDYPEHKTDTFFNAARMLCTCLALCGIFPAATTMNRIVLEKERQLKMVMKIMGMNNCLHWVAWFVDYMAVQGIIIILTLIAFKVAFSEITVFPKTSWSVLLVFLLLGSISCISFHFMLSSFFQTVAMATVVQSFLILLFIVVPILASLSQTELPFALKIFFCAHFIAALVVGFKTIILCEGMEIELNWSNIFIPPNPDDSISLGIEFILMIVTSLLFIIICLYVEQIHPGNSGFPKPWYFPFTRKFWSQLNCYAKKDGNRDAFEPQLAGKTVGVQVMNLRKKFGKNEVVKDLTMNMYKDEVTVLLGHNGAGKTTSISMIAGMLPPTSGTVIVNGFDVRKDIHKVRQSLGICPQHDTLFGKLTVEDHLRFFCRLKGLEGPELKSEISTYLNILGTKISKKCADDLSGGMKRKLSLCCAMCAGSTAVLCDEPTAGLDPVARRQVWNLILRQKSGRTILLTTHLMDEADILGDSIAIMAGGELKCQGTSFSLKKEHSSGYQLACTKAEGCNEDDVTKLISTHIPNSKPSSVNASEITYVLAEQYSPIFARLFRDLERNSEDLRLTGFGVNITTLEDVFMKVGAEKHPPKHQRGNLLPFKIQRKHQKSGFTLFCYRLWAMQLKNMSYNYFKKTLLCIQVLVPLLVAVSPLIFNNINNDGGLNDIPIHLKNYASSFGVLETTPDVGASSLEDMISKQYQHVVTSDGGKFESTGGQILSKFLGQKAQSDVNIHYIIGATIDAKDIVARYSKFVYHSAPMTLNIAYNAIAKGLIDDTRGIEISNKPLPDLGEDREPRLTSLHLVCALTFALILFLAFFVIFPIMERRMRTKLLFYISGTSSWLFWITHWLWDIFIFTIFMLIISLCYGLVKEGSFSTFPEERHMMLFLYIYGVTFIPVLYAFSYIFAEETYAFTTILTILQLASIIAFIPAFFPEHIKAYIEFLNILHPFALVEGLLICLIVSIHAEVCRAQKYSKDDLASLCKVSPNCCGELYPFFQFKPPGVLKEILFMTSAGIVCLLIIILYDLGMFNCLKKIRCTRIPKRSGSRKCCCDEDVIRERYKIENMTKKDRTPYNLITNQLTKYYCRVLAVSKISFAVQTYECFGLLGINGCGKSSTFKMLTGETVISSGDAYVKGHSVRRNVFRACREIGYCPQFDALPEHLPGRLTLRIFCLLHGIPHRYIKRYIVDLSLAFGFTKHLDKQIRKYSGGNKRKLSTAVAIIGNPSLIYLDEPTAGIDPAAKRMLWTNITHLRDSGKSIILTSHSLEECEAYCTRLTIMIGGVLRCLGSIQHLKNKFSKGMVLKIKANLNAQEYQTEKHVVDEIKESMHYFFINGQLQEEYNGLLTYYLPSNDYKWSEIFGIMEENRSKLPIEDYSVSQTTLEEIFLHLANNDTKTDGHICTCD